MDATFELAVQATSAWQECMIALDCGDLEGADGVEIALDADRRLDGVMVKVASVAGVCARGTLRFSLRDYADRMRHAIAYRAKGDVAEALRWEDSANRIYRQIPKTWRW